MLGHIRPGPQDLNFKAHVARDLSICIQDVCWTLLVTASHVDRQQEIVFYDFLFDSVA